MLRKVIIFALSLLTTQAYPLHHTSREASDTQQDLKYNEAHEKTDNKDVDGIWKSHVKNIDLYTHDSANLMVSEMRRKLNMESERLHTRLRQELTELRERLSPYPAHPESSESTLAIMGERLAPLTEQLQRAMNDDGEELCGRLRHYLQALEDTTPYQDAVTWLSQTLDDSSAKMSSIIQDFKTKASNMIEEFKGTDEGISWQEVNVRLEQEVRALSLEVQGRMGALKAKVSRFLLVPQAARAEVSTSMEQFCQSAAIQDPSFHTRIEKHLFGHVSQAQSQSQSPTLQPLGSLEEDFSAKLNAVLRDILQTVQ